MRSATELPRDWLLVVAQCADAHAPPLDGGDEPLRRYYRPHLHKRFHQRHDLAADDLRRSLDDAATRPGLLAEILGPAVAAGPSSRERLMRLLDRLDPSGAGWPVVSFAELPMNRWEVRFRFPERRPVRAPGLREASEAFVARREPCRVLLPPVVGEIRELLGIETPALLDGLGELGMEVDPPTAPEDWLAHIAARAVAPR